jgi:transposase
MWSPFPSALRARFLKDIEEGLSGRAAALRLKLSAATGARWAHQFRVKCHAEPAPQGPQFGRRKLARNQAF